MIIAKCALFSRQSRSKANAKVTRLPKKLSRYPNFTQFTPRFWTRRQLSSTGAYAWLSHASQEATLNQDGPRRPDGRSSCRGRWRCSGWSSRSHAKPLWDGCPHSRNRHTSSDHQSQGIASSQQFGSKGKKWNLIITTIRSPWYFLLLL